MSDQLEKEESKANNSFNLKLDEAGNKNIATTEYHYTARAASLLEAKRIGRQIENDSMMLTNRINLLKMENSKTVKKISMTKKRLKEVERNRANTERRKHDKQRFQEFKQDQQSQIQNNISQLREERKTGRGELKKTILEKNKEKAEYIKSIRSESLSKLVRLNNKSLNLKHQNAIKMRESQILGKYKRQNRLMKIREIARKEYNKRLELMEKWRENREKELLQMELIEMDLIKKLQDTQQLQKKTFKKLEDTLSNNNQIQQGNKSYIL